MSIRGRSRLHGVLDLTVGLKKLLAWVIGTAVFVAVISRSVGTLTNMNNVSRLNMARFGSILSNISVIGESPHNSILFVGSSTFYLSLDAQAVARAFPEPLRGFNLSMEGLYGVALHQFMKRVRHEMPADQKFKAIYIEYSPHMLSRFRDVDGGNRRLLTGLEYLSWQMLFSEIPANPLGGIQTILLKLFQPTDLKGLLGESLRPGLEPYKVALTLAMERTAPHFRESTPWDPSRGGFYNWNRAVLPEEFDSYVKKVHAADNWKSLIEMNLVLHGLGRGFGVSDTEVSHLVSTIDIARSMAETVYLLRLPLSPDLQATFLKHVDYQAVDKIFRNKAPILDLSNAKTVNEDFIDPSHMKPEPLIEMARDIAKGSMRATRN